MGRPCAHWSLREDGVFGNRHEKVPGTGDVVTAFVAADEDAVDVVGVDVDGDVDGTGRVPELDGEVPAVDGPDVAVSGTVVVGVVVVGAGLVGVNFRGRYPSSASSSWRRKVDPGATVNDTDAADASGVVSLPAAPASPDGTVTFTVVNGIQPPAGVNVMVEPAVVHEPATEGEMVGWAVSAAKGAEKWRVTGVAAATFVAFAVGENDSRLIGVGGIVVGAAFACDGACLPWLTALVAPATATTRPTTPTTMAMAATPRTGARPLFLL